MGASQEQLDWDESDMGGTLSEGGGAPTSLHPGEGEEAETCEMIKVEDSTLREPRVRLVHHQYEDVVLGEEDKGDEALKESWVGGEGAGLPRGWQQMRDDGGKEYYWHIPTGRTQYSPPAALSPVKVSLRFVMWSHPLICGTTPPYLCSSLMVMASHTLLPLPHVTPPLSPRPSRRATWGGCPLLRANWSQDNV